MSHLNLMLGITDVFAGALILLVSVPLVLGKVARNDFYGMRYKESMASDEAWYAINRYGAAWMMVWSAGLIAFGVVLFFVPVESGSWLCWAGALAPLLMLVPGLQGYLFAKRFASTSTQESRDG